MHPNHVPWHNGMDRLNTDGERNTVSYATQAERKLEAKTKLRPKQGIKLPQTFQATVKEEKANETSYKGVGLDAKNFLDCHNCLYDYMFVFSHGSDDGS